MELFNDWDAKAFAEHLGMSAVHLSRVETGKRPVLPVMNSHAVGRRLGLAKQQQIPFDDLEPFVAELEATWNVAGHLLQHIDNAPPDQEWEPAVA